MSAETAAERKLNRNILRLRHFTATMCCLIPGSAMACTETASQPFDHNELQSTLGRSTFIC
jgi:hypothetical protein